MKIHFASIDAKSACGRTIADDNLTNDANAVTCGNCLRTKAVKTALDLPEDAVGILEVEAE